MALRTKRVITAAGFRPAGLRRFSEAALGTWPGQAGNPVGFAAAPAVSSVWAGGTRPGAWPGSFTGGGPISTAAYASANPTIWTSGTPGNPKIVAFVDFDTPGSNNSISNDGADHASLANALHDVTFFGCRFQGSAFTGAFDVECWKNNSSNIAFIYCSFTPRRTAGPFYSKVLSPGVLDVAQPGSWPSGSVGTGITDFGGGISPINGGTNGGLYQTPILSSAAFGLGIGSTAGTYMIVDHCDFWGNNFGISPSSIYTSGTPSASTTPITISDCWIHDSRFPACPSWDPTFNYIADTTFFLGAYVQGSDNNEYLALINSGPSSGGAVNPVGDVTGHWGFHDTNDHTNGISFAQGTDPAQYNWTIRHCTIASLGNTRALGWQSTNFNYQNNKMINNYLSGYNDSVDMGTIAVGSINTGWVFTDNIFATDLPFTNTVIDHSGSSPNGVTQTQFSNTGAFAGANNLWRRNILKIYPGDTWSGFNAFDGQFVMPNGAGGSHFSTVDWAS
jgi:hypothetical protein